MDKERHQELNGDSQCQDNKNAQPSAVTQALMSPNVPAVPINSINENSSTNPTLPSKKIHKRFGDKGDPKVYREKGHVPVSSIPKAKNTHTTMKITSISSPNYGVYYSEENNHHQYPDDMTVEVASVASLENTHHGEGKDPISP